MNSIIDLFMTVATIPDDDIEQISQLITCQSITQNDYFLLMGDVPKTLGFVKKGLFRYYYVDSEGNEYTKGFFPEGNILVSYSALLENRPSYFAIQALEHSEIEQLDYRSFTKMFGHTHWYKDVIIFFVQKAYCIKEERERQLLILQAEERYKLFFERFPGIDRRIKQHYIASYLGIKPETLSRLRKKMGLLT